MQAKSVEKKHELLRVEILRPIVIGVKHHEIGEKVDVPDLFQTGVLNVHAMKLQEGGPRVKVLNADTFTRCNVRPKDVTVLDVQQICETEQREAAENPNVPGLSTR
jgi:hypothetical protein